MTNPIPIPAHQLPTLRETGEVVWREWIEPQPERAYASGVYAPLLIDTDGFECAGPFVFGIWGDGWDTPAPYQPGQFFTIEDLEGEITSVTVTRFAGAWFWEMGAKALQTNREA